MSVWASLMAAAKPCEAKRLCLWLEDRGNYSDQVRPALQSPPEFESEAAMVRSG